MIIKRIKDTIKSLRYNKKLLGNEKGLTLVEIIVVLIILAVVLSVLAGKIFSSGDKIKRDTNRLKMNQLKSSIQEYQLRYNSLPPSIDALVSGPPGGGSGSVAVTDSESIKDVWGNPYLYQLNDNRRSFTIKTLGADGVEGGEGPNFDDELTGP